MNRLFALAAIILVVAPALAQDKPPAKAPTAVITLEKGGEITLEFFPADAPKTVENFVTLAKQGFYNGPKFHRVEPGFVAQGGDPKADGIGRRGYTLRAESNG